MRNPKFGRALPSSRFSTFSAATSAAETNSPGPLIETWSCSTSPKSRFSPRAALRQAAAMTLISAERAGADMRRQHDAPAVRQFARLVGRRRGLPLHHRIGLDHLHHHGLRQRHAERHALEQLQRAQHALLEEVCRLPDGLFADGDLLEVLVVHERRHVAVEKEELHVLLVEASALNRFLRTVARVGLGAGLEIAHLDLGEGTALAGLDELALDHKPELAVLLEHVAGFDVDGIDLHGASPCAKSRSRSGFVGCFVPACPPKPQAKYGPWRPSKPRLACAAKGDKGWPTHRGGTATASLPGRRFSRRAARRCELSAATSTPRASSKSTPPRCRSAPASRFICARSRRRSTNRASARGPSSCIPRRNSR